MPQLTNQIVAFLDLLGFRAEMAGASDIAASQALLDEYDSVLRAGLEELQPEIIIGGVHIADDVTYRGFTDNFLIASPLPRDDHVESFLGDMTIRIAEFQMALAQRGWFIRGGVTTGPFYMDDRLVFGPALLDSYELESRHARDPRVILSSSVASLVRRHLRYYADPYHDAPQTGYVLKDTDGRYFINYLYAARGRDADLDTIIAEVLLHKFQVETALEASLADPPVWAKYRWVASYHNFFCRTWLPSPREWMISGASLAAEPRLLVQRPRRRPAG